MSGLIRFLLWTALLIGAVVGVARLVAIRWLTLPTDDPVFTASLQPTLGAGETILLQRVAPPEFGDLVLCPEPGYPERYIIGRVLGLPGDEVHVENGQIEVNGRNFPFERTCHPDTVTYPHPDRPDEQVEQACSYEAVASQRVHQVGRIHGHQVRAENRKFDVPEEHYFLVSDNRLFPYDSRDYGVVERDTCKETVIARLVGKKGWNDVEKRMTLIQ